MRVDDNVSIDAADKCEDDFMCPWGQECVDNTCEWYSRSRSHTHTHSSSHSTTSGTSKSSRRSSKKRKR